jgi:multidrug efflux system outer membrane protein
MTRGSHPLPPGGRGQGEGGTSRAAPLLALALSTLLAACAAVGPDYQRPPVETPPAWSVEAPWRPAAPADAEPKGDWWLRFGDPQLDALQRQAAAGNQTLALAGARLEQARAVLRVAGAGLLPSATLQARQSRARISANRPLTSYSGTNFAVVQDDSVLSLGVAWELDVAGRIRRAIESAEASAEQSAADLGNAQLLVQTDLATAYFNLRATDIELDALARSIALQRRALDFVGTRYELGASSGVEVAQQRALLDTTLTQAEILRRQRGPFEHAIATLTGTPAPRFALAPDTRIPAAPPIPIGIPSDVLERRPDVAAAERAMAAANAQIGVATAAWYPSITLNPSVGFESRAFESLFSAPSVLWSLGAQLAQPLFSAGRIRGNVDVARAAYDATVAGYRRTVLVAMQEVEDGISSIAALERANERSRIAVESARRVLDLSTARYEGGATTFLDVIAAQQTLLTAERLDAQVAGQRAIASVFLVKALGGDFGPRGLASAR